MEASNATRPRPGAAGCRPSTRSSAAHTSSSPARVTARHDHVRAMRYAVAAGSGARLSSSSAPPPPWATSCQPPRWRVRWTARLSQGATGRRRVAPGIAGRVADRPQEGGADPPARHEGLDGHDLPHVGAGAVRQDASGRAVELGDERRQRRAVLRGLRAHPELGRAGSGRGRRDQGDAAALARDLAEAVAPVDRAGRGVRLGDAERDLREAVGGRAPQQPADELVADLASAVLGDHGDGHLGCVRVDVGEAGPCGVEEPVPGRTGGLAGGLLDHGARVAGTRPALEVVRDGLHRGAAPWTPATVPVQRLEQDVLQERQVLDGRGAQHRVRRRRARGARGTARRAPG